MSANYDNIIMMAVFLCGTFICGILAGVLYFNINILDSSLNSVNFQIPLAQNSTTGAVNVTTFHDALEITVNQVLGMKDYIPYLTYFMIFAFMIAMGVTAYVSTKNPVFFVVHILSGLLFTYIAETLSNAYQGLLTDPFMNSIMADFGVYNLIMIYLPQIFFFTMLLFGIIGFIGLIKPSTKDNPYGINYGGDY